MSRIRFTIARASVSVLAASLLGAVMLAPNAAASTSACTSSGKCFAVTVSPAGPAAGANTSFAFAITNEASTQQLGSVQITAPAGFVITGAPGSASFTSSTVLFLNLSLAPSGTTTLTVTALLPCSDESYQWPAIQAKQSNDFNGPPGNEFQLDPASAANLSGSVTGSCSLAFTSDGQPAGTSAGAFIKSGFASQGGPVKVGLLDASGKLISNPAATGAVSVTVKIGSNPGGGSLSGTTTMQASGGVASFSDLAINPAGIGYTLLANISSGSSGSAINPGTSADFTIFGSLQRCSTTPCSAKSSTTRTTGTVTTSSVTSADLLGSGIGGVSVDYRCGTYQPASDPFSFDVFSSSGIAQSSAQFSVSLDISKSAVQSSGRTSASSWQVCYASTSSFTPLPDTSGTAVIGGVSYFTGLLPDCSSTPVAPCVQARNKGNGGDVIITFLAAGDPVVKG